MDKSLRRDLSIIDFNDLPTLLSKKELEDCLLLVSEKELIK